jgi:hypothetical protein
MRKKKEAVEVDQMSNTCARIKKMFRNGYQQLQEAKNGRYTSSIDIRR